MQLRQSEFAEEYRKLQGQLAEGFSNLAEVSNKLAEENRALYAELHEAKTLFDFIKTQLDPDKPPQ